MRLFAKVTATNLLISVLTMAVVYRTPAIRNMVGV